MSPATVATRSTRDNHYNRGFLLLFCAISVFTSVVFMPIANAKIISLSRIHVLPRATKNGTDFDWKKLKPSSDLNWVPCLDGRECARLEVPLDYSAPSREKAAVALVRVKSKVSPQSKKYRGPVLFNPGGPGGSGVLYIDLFGEELQHIVGNEYDIVGFDPRGIGATTPEVSIFPDAVEREYWNAGAPPVLNSTSDALPRAISRAHLFNGLVESRSKKAAQHASTAVVARDMLSITKAHGRERINYWGISYGTVLGATYAAMFPHNIERMIIDGVLDFDDYYSGSWSKNLFDTDKVLQFFYEKCASAGPACPLHANSSALVQQRVEALLESVKANPVPVINGTNYGLVDFTILKQVLFQSLYSPFSSSPPLAQAMVALESGDAQPAFTLFSMDESLPKCDTPPQVETPKQEAQLAVLCGEAKGVVNTASEILQHFEELSRVSIFADIWTDESRIPCAGWQVHPTERFAGPFAVNTSFPLLVIGNTADPVTPLVGAKKAARTFEGSALLTINTPGHTSRASSSLCVNKIIRDYFSQGDLPNEGTVCDIEDVLFGDESNTWQST